MPNVWTNLGLLREVLQPAWTDSNSFLKIRLGIVILLTAIASVSIAMAPLAMMAAIDSFMAREVASTALVFLVLFVMCHWLSRVLGDVRELTFGRFERRTYRQLSDRLFSHIMNLPLRFHLERKTGALSETLTQGIAGYELVLQALFSSILPVICELVTVVVVLVSLDQPQFLVVYCLAVMSYSIAFGYGVKRIGSASRDVVSSQIDAHASMTDGILNCETVKYFAAEPIIRERHDSVLARTELEWIRLVKRRVLSSVSVNTVFIVFLSITLFYAAGKVNSFEMTIGTFTLISSYALKVVYPIETLGAAFQRLAQGFGFLEKAIVLLREVPEPVKTARTEVPRIGGSVEFENVRFSYRPEYQLLSDASFKVPAGKTLAIVGLSGAGKSTIVRLLVRLLQPIEGRILLGGTDISDLPLAALRQAIGVVPQDTALLNDTIAYNIAFGRPGCTREEIERAAKLAHLHNFIMNLPDGYETLVGERGVKLSGGERQRISLARAAIKRPKIYVFDEATSSLDSRTEREILQNFGEISKFCTTIVIAHRLSTVMHADEIMVLDGGRVAELGKHEVLLQRNGKYASLWNAQQKTSTEDVRACVS